MIPVARNSAFEIFDQIGCVDTETSLEGQIVRYRN